MNFIQWYSRLCLFFITYTEIMLECTLRWWKMLYFLLEAQIE